MKLIVTTKAQATIEEQWVVEVPDETDYLTDDGHTLVANAFFYAVADVESPVKIESHGMVGEPDVTERNIFSIEGLMADDMTPEVAFWVDGTPVYDVGTVRAIAFFPPGMGVNKVQVVLSDEGVIIDAFNEDEECFATEAFTYDEWLERQEP